MRYLLLCIVIIFSCSSSPQTTKDKPLDVYQEFSILLNNIRTEVITPDSAKTTYQDILSRLQAKYKPTNSNLEEEPSLVFPLRTKNYKSVGGKGKGFYAKYFNLFDQSISKSHPAHDIFIYDVNKDCIEDISMQYIECVSVTKSIVLATETNWYPELGFKGGNYVWLYDIATGGLWYYAHLRQVDVVPGQQIEAGITVGQVGRSGFNAETNRSDTHLHLMFLQTLPDFLPLPIDHYKWLKEAKTVY